MEPAEVLNTQYSLPVCFVLVCAILVFVFGFKSAEQPQFAQFSTLDENRTKSAGKKRKGKDKKPQSNGHVVTEDQPEKGHKPSPSKEVARAKDTKKEKKQEVVDNKAKQRVKGQAAAEVLKNRKNEKNLAKLRQQDEKPVDFDDGEWERALTRKEKKNRKKDEIVDEQNGNKELQSPSKKKKKSVKNIELVITHVPDNKAVEIEPVVEEVNKEDIVLSTPEEKTKPKKKEKKKVSPEKKVDEIKLIAETELPKQPVQLKSAEPAVPKSAVEKSQAKPEVVRPVHPEPESPVAFDELGDVWKEARLPKKSKKKVRKE